jgi:hypothetical protein
MELDPRKMWLGSLDLKIRRDWRRRMPRILDSSMRYFLKSWEKGCERALQLGLGI